MKNIYHLGAYLISFILLTSCSGSHADHPDKEHANHEEKVGHHADHQEKEKEIEVEWKFEELKANKEQKITIQVRHTNGDEIEEFEINHDKLMHLIVVSKDLSYYNHIHPEYKGNGKFEVYTSFPFGGEYRLVSDFIPKEKGQVIVEEWIELKGTEHKEINLLPDYTEQKNVQDIEITLELSKLVANEDVILTYTFKDKQNGSAITNLQTYLGAIGHVVIMDKGANEYLHVHPLKENKKGPTAKFDTHFPKPGLYKIWGEFKHKDQVFIVPFVVKIP